MRVIRPNPIYSLHTQPKSKIQPKAYVNLEMAMGRVFSGTRPTLNRARFNFNKRVWDGYEIFFKPGAGSGIAPMIYKIKFNLKFYFTIFNIYIIKKINKISYKKYNIFYYL